MDLPYQEERIGKHTYRAVALPMKPWAALCESLSEFLGEPVGALVKGFDVGDVRELLLGDAGAIAVLIATFAKKLTAQRLLSITAHMAPALKVMGERGDFEDMSMIHQELWWAKYRSELPGAVALFLKVQYEDFFSGFAAFVPIKSAKPESRSENTSGLGE